jgi:hypothetical protein
VKRYRICSQFQYKNQNTVCETWPLFAIPRVTLNILDFRGHTQLVQHHLIINHVGRGPEPGIS